MSESISKIVTLALIILYLAARLWRLTDSCLWFDEIFSVHAAGHEWSSLFWFVAQDLIHPPLFYVLLKVWIAIGGENLFWLRLLPVLFSVLALVPLIYLCRELKLKTPVVLLSLAFLAVNGSLIKYAQEVRMYSLLMLMSLLSMWLFARYFNRGKSFIPLVIVNILLVYTHYFGWLAVGTEVIVILIFQRIKWQRIAVMFGVVLASFIPWIVAGWQAASGGSELSQNIGWMTRPGFFEVGTFALDLIEPFYFQASNAEPVSIYSISIPLFLICLTSIVIYLINWKHEDEKRTVYFFGLFAFLPFVIAFTASWLLPHSVWGTRHLIIVFAPLSILFAIALTNFATGTARTISFTLILLFSSYAFYLHAVRETPAHVWCAWEPIAADLKSTAANAEPPVRVYALENLVAYHLWFALRDSERFQVSVVKGVDVRTDDETYFLPRGFEKVEKSELREINSKKIWLAFRTSKTGEDIPLLENFRRIGYRVTTSNSTQFGSTTVFLFEMEF